MIWKIVHFFKREEAEEDESETDVRKEEDDVFKKSKGMLPSATEKKTSIDILLKETDTVWMFVLPGLFVCLFAD